jgi:hypothetical protein
VDIRDKIFSGRYFITVCAGVAFVWGAISGVLPETTVGVIIVMVFDAYFNKIKH